MKSQADRQSVVAENRSAETTTFPKISVIIPVRNEAAFIADTLTQLINQDYPTDRFEILVADGQSTDDTRTIVTAIAHHYPCIRLLNNPRRWSSAGRNLAARAATGDIILLIDGHCQIDNSQYLKNLADAFQRSGADCVGRPQPLDIRGANLTQKAIATARTSRLGHHPDSHIYSDREGFVLPDSVAVAYHRRVFERLGYFDESFDACEDVEFNHRIQRAGFRCFFTPKVAVRYVPRDSVYRLYTQMIRYGRGRVRLLRKHPDTFSFPGFIPAAFLAGLIAGPLLCLMFSPLWMVYASIVGLYAALVCLTSLTLAVQKRQPAFSILLPMVFMTIHLGAGSGIWLELLSGMKNQGRN